VAMPDQLTLTTPPGGTAEGEAGSLRLGTKERVIRSIPVDEELATWIMWRVEQRTAAMKRGGPAWLLSTTLFSNPTAHGGESRWIATALRREWHRACEHAGLDVHVKMYEGTKRAFATDALARGIPKEVVQKYLGHADARSTDRYARLANTALLSVLRGRRGWAPFALRSRRHRGAARSLAPPGESNKAARVWALPGRDGRLLPAYMESRLSTAGAADMAGNVSEWVWNASGENRFLLGGSWEDPEYKGIGNFSCVLGEVR